MAVALIWQGMPEICGFFTRPESPRNPGIVCCLAREVMLLWFGLPQSTALTTLAMLFQATLSWQGQPGQPLLGFLGF